MHFHMPYSVDDGTMYANLLALVLSLGRAYYRMEIISFYFTHTGVFEGI